MSKKKTPGLAFITATFGNNQPILQLLLITSFNNATLPNNQRSLMDCLKILQLYQLITSTFDKTLISCLKSINFQLIKLSLHF